ncbi:hypothetical protein B0H11DRAFT_2222632 [Mycena galericulata]|nr:hypothetical protein B0H11DRAFT_2222632 [Mycena galericulata]
MATASPQEKAVSYQRLSDLGLVSQPLNANISNGGPVPGASASDHSSRPSLDAVRKDIVDQIKKADQVKKTCQAAPRDGFRCVVTGLHDDDLVTEFPDDFPPSTPTTLTQCAHIFSESAQNGDKEVYAATASVILKMFNFDIDSLLGGQSNTVRNVLTVSMVIHSSFNELQFWFEEVVGQPNTYDMCSWGSNFFNMNDRPRRRITPLSVDPDFAARYAADGIAPPDLPTSTLLSIRAAVSRVAHMSSAAEQYEMAMRDRETTTVMSDDAVSAHNT